MGGAQPLVSQTTIAELARVLSYPKFRLSPLEQLDLLSDYVPFCEVVEVSTHCSVFCRDPKDQPLLDLAYSGRAEVLVTGDADLLALAAQTPFAIETPEQYRARFVR